MKNEDIRKAFDSISPSEEAKERMLRNIMAKAGNDSVNESSAKPECAAPWYIRFRPQLGAVGALAACAAVAAAFVLNPAFKKSESNDFVQGTRPAVTSEAVTSARETEATAAETTAVSETSQTKTSECTTVTTAVSSAETKKAETSAALTSKAVCHTTSTSVCTEPVCAATVSSALTTVSSAPETTTVSTASITQSLYGDPFDFRSVSWAGVSYSTDYAEISYSKLSGCLGSGVAMSDEMGTYTILLYQIQGVPVEDAVAVQYIGQTNFYYFYRS